MFAFRQYYIYATDTTCKRMGTQCWTYCAIMFCEGILCIKNGKELFSQTHMTKVISWLLIQAVLSIMFVSACVLWHKYIQVSTFFAQSVILSMINQNQFARFRSRRKISKNHRQWSRNQAERLQKQDYIFSSNWKSFLSTFIHHLDWLLFRVKTCALLIIYLLSGASPTMIFKILFLFSNTPFWAFGIPKSLVSASNEL